MEQKTIAITDVQIGPRHRKDNGDLEELAESIQSQGLLQPIGVNGSNSLVFGMRRLLACRDILQWTQIPCRIVEVSSMLAGEFTENEVRKNFTPSERDSIRRAIESEIKERRGRPDKQDATREEGNCGQLATISEGEKTRDFSARKAGFKSTTEARRVRTAVNNGVPEVVEAMDKGEISESAAAKLAAFPKKEQKAALKARKRKSDNKPSVPKSMRLTNRTLANATLSQKVGAMREDIAAGTRPLEVHAHYGVSRSEYAKLRAVI
jgi:ParB-like chromosome segregation protein Spo0J